MPNTPNIITLDLETTGTDWNNDKILLNGYRINRRGNVLYANPNSVDPALNELLSCADNILCGHSIKFDALFLARQGYSVNCKLEDTRVMAYVCWPTEEAHGLKDLVRSKLNGTPTELSSLLFSPLKAERNHFADFSSYYWNIDGEYVRRDLLTRYHREDVLNVDRLRALMIPPKWFYDVEMPLTRIIFEMEYYGCPLDREYLELLKFEYEGKVNALLEKLKEGKEDFNPNSTKQVAERLITNGVDLERLAQKTKTGAYSVDSDLLKKLAWDGNEWAKSLTEYRRLSKLLGTYIGPFCAGASRDGRLHGSFNQAGSEDLYGDGARGTNTGRLSSSDPNLQNIPARTKEGKKVRQAFIGTKGWHPFNSDLAQIEPRFVGHLSQSPALIKAYAQNLDTHGLMACSIFGKDNITDLTKMERFIGKSSWLATVYGCSYKKLLWICEHFSDEPLAIPGLERYAGGYDTLPAKTNPRYPWRDSRESLLKLSGQDPVAARSLYAKWMFFKTVQDTFKQKNPEIMSWAKSSVERARALGYVVTYGGRRIPLPDIQLDPTEYYIDEKGQRQSNKKLISKAERKAINTPVQGSCADVMKLIMVRFHKELVQPGLARIFAVVHDELWGELKSPDLLDHVVDIMENTVKLNNIPVKSDTKLVTNWSEK